MNSTLLFFALLVLCAAAATRVSGEKRLIELSAMERRLVNEEDLAALRSAGVQFFDAQEWEGRAASSEEDGANAGVFPAQPMQKKFVRELLPQLSVGNIRKTVEHLQSYKTRYYTSESGVEAAQWIGQQYRDLIKLVPFYSGQTSVELRNNTGFPQQSVVVTMIGGEQPDRRRREPSLTASPRVVILGAHLDSISVFGSAPGADDSAVSVATGLEVFRVLLENNFVPPDGTVVSWMAFAAEEVGLRGSSQIAQQMAADKQNVVSMMQLDMTGYVNPNAPEQISLIDDYTSKPMNEFLKLLIAAYTDIIWTQSSAGYAASDHASFFREGYPAAFPFEDAFGDHNPSIHTPQDLLDKLNNGHIGEFAKFALGYVVEMAMFEQ